MFFFTFTFTDTACNPFLLFAIVCGAAAKPTACSQLDTACSQSDAMVKRRFHDCSLERPKWTAPQNQPPGQVSLKLPDGNVLDVWFCTKNQCSDDEFYAHVLRDTGKRITVAGVAAGEGKAYYYPKGVTVIDVPVYHKGKLREQGFQLFWEACVKAAARGEAVICHCNQTFHRGPVLYAAVAVVAGYDKLDALQVLNETRNIYPGHLLDPSTWDDLDPHKDFKSREKMHNLKLAHQWVDALEPARNPRQLDSGRPTKRRDGSNGSSRAGSRGVQDRVEVVLQQAALREKKRDDRAKELQRQKANDAACSPKANDAACSPKRVHWAEHQEKIAKDIARATPKKTMEPTPPGLPPTPAGGWNEAAARAEKARAGKARAAARRDEESISEDAGTADARKHGVDI